MARNGSGVYSLPSGYLATANQTATASQHNISVEDLEADANTARPIVAGGTGATSASGARTNLGIGAAGVLGVTGADTAVVTGTAGTSGNLVQWNADGDAVDSGLSASGADASVITGTAGTSGNYASWNADGDLVDSGVAAGPAASVPSGAVTAFAMNTAPSGWLECDGSAVSRSTYSDLFTAISTTFGVGDGSTTFNLPDLRGEFIRGWDNTRGVDSGRSFGSAQTDEFEAHTHTYTRTNIATTDAASAGSAESEPTGTSTVATGSAGGASETRPRNIALMYCIKA